MFTDRRVSLFAFPAILLVYLCFPTRNYYYDGVFFARVIEEARGLHASLIHPNHLIYEPLGYLFYRACQAVGLRLKAIEVLQIVNSFVSVAGAFVFFQILSQTLQSRYLSWTLTLLFAFSATWWKFSTDSDAYICSVFFLLLSVYFLLPNRKPRPLLVTMTFLFAVLFHQLAVLFYPIAILGLWLQTTKLPREQRPFIIAEFGIAAFALVFSTYYFFYYLASGSLSTTGFARWITSYSPDASFSFNVLSNLGYTLRGHARLFFAGRLGLLKGLFNPLLWALTALLIAMICVFIVVLLKNFKRPQLAFSSWIRAHLLSNHLATLSASWVLIFVGFLFFWLPHNTFYRLFYLPGLILLLGAVLTWSSRLPRRNHYRLALFVAIMAVANFLFSIFPYAHTEKYPPLVLALEMNRAWPPKTVIYYGSANADNNLFAYFNPGTVWKPLSKLEQLEAELAATYREGHKVWLETSAIDQMRQSPAGADWLSRHAREETRREIVDRAYRIMFVQVTP